MTTHITHCDAKGRGVGATEKGGVAVPFTVPGDVVRVAPRGKRHGVRMGVMEEVVTPSPDRVAPRCPYAGRCGGCPWQMFNYAAQLRYKHDAVIHALTEVLQNDYPAGYRFCNTSQKVISAILPSPELYYYRNRMDYAFGADGSLGLREPGSWSRVLDLSTCFLLSEDGVRCMEQVRAWAREHHIPGWDARAHTGFLRYLVLREGKRTGDRLAMLITAPGELPAREDLVRRIAPLTTGVLWGVNDGVADVSHAERYETLSGRAEIREKLQLPMSNDEGRMTNQYQMTKDQMSEHLMSVRTSAFDIRNSSLLRPSSFDIRHSALSFSIPPSAFFQTNTLAAEILIATVRDFAALSPTATLVDLYCGVGMFAIALARDAWRVIGVELERSAIEAARHNAEANGITNATFQVIAAESWPFPIEPVDCLIVDPPRAGLHPKTLAKMLANAPQRIVYVSCNPTALARDLQLLVRAYSVQRIQPIDLFPHSYHSETVVLLMRR